MYFYRVRFLCFVTVLLCIVSLGCPKTPPPVTSQSDDSDWISFVDPKYSGRTYADFEEILKEDLEASRDKVTDLLDEHIEALQQSGNQFPDANQRFTRSDWGEDFRKFRMRDLVFYEKNTSDTGQAKELGANAIEAYINFRFDCWFICDPDVISVKELLKQFEAVREAGSKDQTIHICYAGVLWADGQNEKALEEFSGLALDFNEEQVAPIYGMLFRAWHWHLSKVEKASARATNVRQFRFIDAIVKFLSSDKDDENLRYSWFLLRDSIDQLDVGAKEDLLAAIMERDDISLYNKHLVAGYSCLATGWDRRGGGYANSVTDDGWQGFGELSTSAVRHLERAWQLHPELPDAPTALLYSAMAGYASRPWTTRDWFLEAISAEFDFLPAYRKLSWASRPRWGGSHMRMLQIGEECMDSGAWNTAIPKYALEAIAEVKSELPIGEKIATFSLTPYLAREFTRGHVGAFDEMPKVWKLSKRECALLLPILIENDDFELASKLIDRYQNFYGSIEDSGTPTELRLIGELQLMTSSDADDFRKEREILNAPGREFSPELAEPFLAAINRVRSEDDRPTIQAILNHYEEQVRQITEFEKGDWIDLPFTKGLPGWRIRAGEFELLSDSKILLKKTSSVPKPSMELVSEFSCPLIVEASFKLIDAEKIDNKLVEIGINLGAIGSQLAADEQSCFFGFEPEVAVLTSEKSTAFSRYRGWQVPLVEDTNQIRIEFWDKAAIVYVNDRSVGHTQDLNVFPSSLLAFAPLMNTRAAPCSFELSDVRVRKQKESYVERILAFHEKDIETAPEDPAKLIKYATAMRGLDKYEEALNKIKKALEIDPNNPTGKIEHFRIVNSSGDFQSAKDMLEKLLSENPNDLLTLNTAAWFLATSPNEEVRDGERAIKYAEQACQQTQFSNYAILDTLAASYAENGQFSMATRTQEQAIRLAPANSREELMEHYQLFIQELPVRETE